MDQYNAFFGLRLTNSVLCALLAAGLCWHGRAGRRAELRRAVIPLVGR